MSTAASEGDFGGICGGQLLSETFSDALRRGKICVTLADLVDAVLNVGTRCFLEAMAFLRHHWLNSSFQCFCEMPEPLQREFFKHGPEEQDMRLVVRALQQAYVSPICRHLTWPLLFAVLKFLNREHMRPSLDVILEVAREIFGLKCDLWDVLAAVALAPRGSCRVGSAPWPVQRRGDADHEAFVRKATTINLTCLDHDEENRVFPPYDPGLASFVNRECPSADLGIIRGLMEAKFSQLTLPEILVISSFQQKTSARVPGGLVVWVWEMKRASQSRQDGGEPRGEVAGDGSRDSPRASSQGSQQRGCQDETEPTPLEAFISCFYDDLWSNRPLFLSQLNNLYTMRSRGQSLKYQDRGYEKLGDFLAEVPGVELVGSGNQMAVQVCDPAIFKESAEQVKRDLLLRIADLHARGMDTSCLEIKYRRPQAVPQKILARIWRLFQHSVDSEVRVKDFLFSYNALFPDQKLNFKSLGYADVCGLLAQVPFIEKVGGRRQARYVLKADGAPPAGCRGRPALPDSHLRQQCSQPPRPPVSTTPVSGLLDTRGRRADACRPRQAAVVGVIPRSTPTIGPQQLASDHPRRSEVRAQHWCYQ